MTTAFINKVKQIIFDNLDNEHFGVIELASKIGISRSQLLRKVKTVTGKSVNRLIREIRLEEGAKLLLKNNFTASEISYKVGFSSPSYFNKCFLDYYGLTPGEYKNNKDNVETNNQLNSNYNSSRKSQKIKIYISVVVITVLTFIIAFIFFNNQNDEVKPSIAVLPLLDYSKDKNKEYLVDGLTEAITLELSKHEHIRVISRGSPMKYKNKTNLYSRIAKELNVDLLLEGSILYSNDSVRVVVQLIKPFPKEKHLWQNSYDRNTSDILGLVLNVSNEIAEEISKVVEPKKNRIKRKANPETYDLYLRGRHLLNTQKINESSLIKAVKYLNLAIEKDSTFAPAYITLAESFLALNTLIGDNEQKLKNRKKAKLVVDKALHFDDSYAEAYITKGNLVGKIDWNWEEMKILVEKGLKLDPNNAYAKTLLSNYYLIKGDYSKAIDEAILAQDQDPLNPIIGCLLAERYYINHEYEKSINTYKEVLEFNPNYGFAYHGIGYAYLKMNDVNQAIKSWQKLQYIMGNSLLGDCYQNNSFNECLSLFLEKATTNTPRFCRNPAIISSVLMMVGNKREAIEYLNIAYQYKSEDLPIMLTYPDFHPLHNQEEFQKIANNIGIVFRD